MVLEPQAVVRSQVDLACGHKTQPLSLVLDAYPPLHSSSLLQKLVPFTPPQPRRARTHHSRAGSWLGC